MPSGRMPEGSAALSNAERQARHRAKMLAVQPSLAIKRPRRRCGEAVEALERCLAEMIAVQAESLRGSKPCPTACATEPRRRHCRR